LAVFTAHYHPGNSIESGLAVADGLGMVFVGCSDDGRYACHG
jgi:hypothetical protein